MSQTGSIELQHSAEQPVLSVQGDWTLAHYEALREMLAGVDPATAKIQRIDLSRLNKIDTAGATLLGRWLGDNRLAQAAEQSAELSAEWRALLQTVSHALDDCPARPGVKGRSAIVELLEHTGQSVDKLWKESLQLLGFIGLTLESLYNNLTRPQQWRLTPLSAHIEQTGLYAIPIIALLTFMVGAVVAFLGATVLKSFGATIYSVHLVAFSFLREFGVLLTAILMAGRTASAYTAQIGSMKANEEIDAIRTLGLDPMAILVLPRLLAMLISLPILTFIAMLCGIVGGSLVCLLMLDTSAGMILSILSSEIPVQHFYIGLVKAPFFAFLIAIIGCLEGFKASGSAKSVGDHTTSAVVQSIFVVILLDAIAAMFFMEMDW